ncbi:hypothetical protein [Synechococcus sp. MIT S9504]|uniref:hypothetical protein n=1 Tax=Synechococcus sp. MIT S9504 TaxID=1801628 RepID=UPI0007BC2C67|nr:hypothetical protein [Synechococcus sp. MIT S9504]KZR86665.1 hypothetical protein MITS9504_01269 [Synechococcus sp. MIT S9504]
MENWINDAMLPEKPHLTWIDSYVKGDGSIVDGHFRTIANETEADNLGTDVDNDGLSGYIDADANGDGILEAADINNDGIADTLYADLDGDGVIDTVIDTLFG